MIHLSLGSRLEFNMQRGPREGEAEGEDLQGRNKEEGDHMVGGHWDGPLFYEVDIQEHSFWNNILAWGLGGKAWPRGRQGYLRI